MNRRAAELPAWLHSRHVLPAALVVALGVVAVAAGFVAYERQEIGDNARQRNALFARLLEDQTSRALNSVVLTLTATGNALRTLPGDTPAGATSAMLVQAIQAQPFLRSLSLLDGRGRVLASSNADNLGLAVPLAQLGLRPGSPATSLGSLQPARDLSGLATAVPGSATPAGVAASAPAEPTLWLLPMGLQLPDQRVLVAALSPDYFANQYPLLIADEPVRAALLADNGTLLASSQALPLAVGQRASRHAVFTDWLPHRERGQFTGQGLDDAPALLAFRSAARHPLVVLVETPQQVLQTELRQVATAVGLVTSVVLAALAALAVLGWRSLRGFEAARGDLATARGTLAAQDAFTDRLFQVSPVPMVVKDTDGRFTRVNQAWSAFTGIPPERAVGSTLGRLYPPQLAAPHEVQEQMVINTGQAVSYEDQVLDSDGLPRDVLIRVVPFTDQADATAGVIVCLTDVTEFREAEVRTTEAREAAERANTAKTEFLANISHELRTPLQGILGFSELGRQRSGHEPRLQGMFTDVHQAGERMLALVNNLLDLSRIDSAVGEVALVRQDITPLLPPVVHELRELAGRRRLTIGLPESGEPLWAHADGVRLQQVLRNLLANAIRFSPRGSTITLDWRRDPVAGDLRISVADEGPGIPEDELESIFEAFVQSSRTKDGSGGTGLGLAICRKIMAAHHGTVRASNRAGGGAVFEIRLPSARSPKADAPAGR